MPYTCLTKFENSGHSVLPQLLPYALRTLQTHRDAKWCVVSSHSVIQSKPLLLEIIYFESWQQLRTWRNDSMANWVWIQKHFPSRKYFAILIFRLFPFSQKKPGISYFLLFVVAQDNILRIFRYTDDKRTECIIETKERYWLT